MALLALVYLCAGALLLLVALIKERGAENYHAFCGLLGLCLLWPITITLEILLARHSRKARQAIPKV